MAISDIISFGFGNGTFDPGVNKLPTLGYSIGEAVTAIRSGCWAKGEVYKPGFKEGEVYKPGFQEGQKVC